MILNDNHHIIEIINLELASRDSATIHIINDKLTLSVFDMLKKNVSNVKSIDFIIRDKNQSLSLREVAREFELDLSDHSDTGIFFNDYDIVQKSNLTYLYRAKSMYEFIVKSVNVRKTLPDCAVNGNLIIIDDDFMIHGSSSLEISNKKRRHSLTEIDFNSMSKDKAQIAAFKQQFEALWHADKYTADYKDELLNSLRYVYKEYSPEFLYYFTLNELFGRQLDQTVERFEKDNLHFKNTKIWNVLYPFQKDCVLSAIQKLNNYGGCIIADSVGLGKTFEALAVIKYFEKRNDNVLVLIPAKLYDNWLSFKGAYKDSFLEEEFNYKIMFHTDLSRYGGESRSGWDLSRFDWSKFDLIVIDESHNFRNRNYREDGFTRYQRLLEEVIRDKQKTKVLLLSATPVNNSLVDLKNQISLITADNDGAFAEYGIKSVSDVMKTSSGVINAWSNGADGGGKGVIFCFKHANIHEKPDSDSLLYPYYLVYISEKGEVVYGNGRSRDTLKFFRFMGNNHTKPAMELVKAFLNETEDTKDMSVYSSLLNKSIRAIQGQEEAHSERSLFDFGGYQNSFASDSLVIK